jgi:hypothetical protein
VAITGVGSADVVVLHSVVVLHLVVVLQDATTITCTIKLYE